MDLPIHTDEQTLVVLGVDTHAAVALDGLGSPLGNSVNSLRLFRRSKLCPGGILELCQLIRKSPNTARLG